MRYTRGREHRDPRRNPHEADRGRVCGRRVGQPHQRIWKRSAFVETGRDELVERRTVVDLRKRHAHSVADAPAARPDAERPIVDGERFPPRLRAAESAGRVTGVGLPVISDISDISDFSAGRLTVELVFDTM